MSSLLIMPNACVSPKCLNICRVVALCVTLNFRVACRYVKKQISRLFRGKYRNKFTARDMTLLTMFLTSKGSVGAVWETIQSNGCCVVAAQIFRLSKVDAGEFLEVYKGVLPEYPDLLRDRVSQVIRRQFNSAFANLLAPWTRFVQPA